MEVGLLGGGSRDRSPILVATYDSAAIHAESLGNLYALLICDECHHLPSDFNRVIAEYAIAPYRLGLTATPDRTIIFTNDNVTVYRISETFLIPAITHQTPVKERHTILQAFRNGDYPCLVVSHVLNEGVDVPEARIAILLSGSGSTREYVQRLGRLLRKGTGNKLALLYEVVAEQTTEENISNRRRKATKSKPSPDRQLELVPVKPVYEVEDIPLPRVAEPDNAPYLKS